MDLTETKNLLDQLLVNSHNAWILPLEISVKLPNLKMELLGVLVGPGCQKVEWRRTKATSESRIFAEGRVSVNFAS